MDTGTGVLESASKGILQLADQLVLVTSPSLDSGRAASSTLDWLERNGHDDLVAGLGRRASTASARRAWSTSTRSSATSARAAARSCACRGTRCCEAGAEASLSDLRPATRAAYLELVGEGRRGLRRSRHDACSAHR